MKATISKSSIHGRAAVPASKSYTLRGFMCAGLARGESELINPLDADDTWAAADVLEKIGISIIRKSDRWLISGGNFHQPATDLYCHESAGTLRFMTALCALVPGRCKLTAGHSLARRPVLPLVNALQQIGIKCYCTGDTAPIVIDGGIIQGGNIELPGNISSQFVSALLMMAPLSKTGITLNLSSPIESKPYISMTLECLSQFGIKVTSAPDLSEFFIPPQSYTPVKYNVEGDWSSASYLLALGAAAGNIEVTGLNLSSQQADRQILDLLIRMGAHIEINNGSIVATKSHLQAIHADLSNCIDLLPTAAILGALAEGTSEFTGIARARLKESDRVASVQNGLKSIGIDATTHENRLIINGSNPHGGLIDSCNDHRIAMAFSIPAILTGQTVIHGAECVNKTFPAYWSMLKQLGGEIKIDE